MARADRVDWHWGHWHSQQATKIAAADLPTWHDRRPCDQADADTNFFSFFCLAWIRTACIGGLAVQKLADQVLQHHGRLGAGNGVPRGQRLLVGTGFQPQVLLTAALGLRPPILSNLAFTE